MPWKTRLDDHQQYSHHYNDNSSSISHFHIFRFLHNILYQSHNNRSIYYFLLELNIELYNHDHKKHNYFHHDNFHELDYDDITNNYERNLKQ